MPPFLARRTLIASGDKVGGHAREEQPLCWASALPASSERVAKRENCAHGWSFPRRKRNASLCTIAVIKA